MRLFIAMPIPELVKAAAGKLQNELRAAVSDENIRWVNTEQLHLTLQFLGEVEPSRLSTLIAAAHQACQGFPPLQLRASQAGVFPHEKKPRVLWVGLHCASDALNRLQEAVENATREFTEKPEDRPFHAHLTLARIKFLRPDAARALIERIHGMSTRVLGSWTADEVEVMQSELHPEGSRHACLEAIELKG
jgi:RNA 2',3'-cyclic 3'-phosphodiesterase